jgi:hypothetical protein
MREFDGRGYSWRVETLYERGHSSLADDSLEQTHARRTFETAWGEQYEWTSMLPVAWKLVGTSDTRIRPSSSTSKRDPSWWFTPLHLLGLGLGWTDIGKGLYEWQRQGYPKGAHPILDLVFNTWGQSIAALEIWLRGSMWTGELEKPLSDLRDEPFESFKLSPIPETEKDELFEEEISRLKRLDLSGRRISLAKNLLSGGYDPLHLSVHFPGSVWPNQDPNHLAFVTDEYSEGDNDAYAINPEEYLWEAYFDRYAGFHVQLNVLAAGMMTGEVFSGKEKVRVHIKNFGYLGEFMRHEKTRRWFLFYESEDVRFDDAHLWGN